MLNFIPSRIASTGLIILFSLIIIFHGLAIVGVVPYEMLWGGRLKDASEMLIFETVSIWVNLIMLAVVLIHSGVWTIKVNSHVTNVALWIMAVLFLLNTIGNLISKNQLEKMIFTPITLLLFIFCLRLATIKRPTKN